MPTEKLKAYIVSNGDPECDTIQFATTNVAARRQGANLMDEDFGSVTCHRLPWADEYAETGVTPAAYIANGWFYECGSCGLRVDSETEAPAYGMDLVFCCEECKADEVAERKAEDDIKQAVIDAALAKFPGITRVKGYVRGEVKTAYFYFPGGSHQVTWEVGKDHVSVSQSDVEHWTGFTLNSKQAAA